MMVPLPFSHPTKQSPDDGTATTTTADAVTSSSVSVSSMPLHYAFMQSPVRRLGTRPQHPQQAPPPPRQGRQRSAPTLQVSHARSRDSHDDGHNNEQHDDHRTVGTIGSSEEDGFTVNSAPLHYAFRQSPTRLHPSQPRLGQQQHRQQQQQAGQDQNRHQHQQPRSSSHTRSPIRRRLSHPPLPPAPDPLSSYARRDRSHRRHNDHASRAATSSSSSSSDNHVAMHELSGRRSESSRSVVPASPPDHCRNSLLTDGEHGHGRHGHEGHGGHEKQKLTDGELALALFEAQQAEEARRIELTQEQRRRDEEMAQSLQRQLESDERAREEKDKVLRRQDEEMARNLAGRNMIQRKVMEEERERQVKADEELARAEEMRMKLEQERRKVEEEDAEQERARRRRSTHSGGDGTSTEGAASHYSGAHSVHSGHSMDEQLARTEHVRERVRQELDDAGYARTLQTEQAHDVRRRVHDQVRDRTRQEATDAGLAQTLQNAESARRWNIPRCDTSSLENQLQLSRCPVHVVTSVAEVRRDMSESVRCSVCLENYVLGDEVRTLPCFHSFHTRCIDRWLERKTECPLCKTPCV